MEVGPHVDVLDYTIPGELPLCACALVRVCRNGGKDVLQREQGVLSYDIDEGMQGAVPANGRRARAQRLATAEKVMVANSPQGHALSMTHHYGYGFQCEIAARNFAFLPKRYTIVRIAILHSFRLGKAVGKLHIVLSRMVQSGSGIRILGLGVVGTSDQAYRYRHANDPNYDERREEQPLPR